MSLCPRSPLTAGCLSLLIFLTAQALASPPVTLYVSHNQPPFVIDQDQQLGLSYELAALLNRQQPETTRFHVQVYPRARLNQTLQPWISADCRQPGPDCPSDWVVLWMNPQWGFGTEAEQRYLQVPLFEDADLILSPAAAPVVYQSPASLRGLRFGGLRGHTYLGIDELAGKGELQRLDSNTEEGQILRLLHDRVDAILLQQSTLHYYQAHSAPLREQLQQLYIAPVPFKRFRLYALIPEGRQDLQRLLETALKSPEWTALRQKYRLTPP